MLILAIHQQHEGVVGHPIETAIAQPPAVAYLLQFLFPHPGILAGAASVFVHIEKLIKTFLLAVKPLFMVKNLPGLFRQLPAYHQAVDIHPVIQGRTDDKVAFPFLRPDTGIKMIFPVGVENIRQEGCHISLGLPQGNGGHISASFHRFLKFRKKLLPSGQLYPDTPGQGKRLISCIGNPAAVFIDALDIRQGESLSVPSFGDAALKIQNANAGIVQIQSYRLKGQGIAFLRLLRSLLGPLFPRDYNLIGCTCIIIVSVSVGKAPHDTAGHSKNCLSNRRIKVLVLCKLILPGIISKSAGADILLTEDFLFSGIHIVAEPAAAFCKFSRQGIQGTSLCIPPEGE